jgi:hypothetical protein
MLLILDRSIDLGERNQMSSIKLMDFNLLAQGFHFLLIDLDRTS